MFANVEVPVPLTFTVPANVDAFVFVTERLVIVVVPDVTVFKYVGPETVKIVDEAFPRLV